MHLQELKCNMCIIKHNQPKLSGAIQLYVSCCDKTVGFNHKITRNN